MCWEGRCLKPGYQLCYPVAELASLPTCIAVGVSSVLIGLYTLRESYLKTLIMKLHTKECLSACVYVKTQWESFQCFSQMLCNSFTESGLGMGDKLAVSPVD